jgi:hypothetical protein
MKAISCTVAEAQAISCDAVSYGGHNCGGVFYPGSIDGRRLDGDERRLQGVVVQAQAVTKVEIDEDRYGDSPDAAAASFAELQQNLIASVSSGAFTASLAKNAETYGSETVAAAEFVGDVSTIATVEFETVLPPTPTPTAMPVSDDETFVDGLVALDSPLALGTFAAIILAVLLLLACPIVYYARSKGYFGALPGKRKTPASFPQEPDFKEIFKTMETNFLDDGYSEAHRAVVKIKQRQTNIRRNRPGLRDDELSAVEDFREEGKHGYDDEIIEITVEE